MHFLGNGKRPNQNYLPCGCKAMLRINFNYPDYALRITTLRSIHNGHDMSADGYARVHSKGRRLSPSDGDSVGGSLLFTTFCQISCLVEKYNFWFSEASPSSSSSTTKSLCSPNTEPIHMCQPPSSASSSSLFSPKFSPNQKWCQSANSPQTPLVGTAAAETLLVSPTPSTTLLQSQIAISLSNNHAALTSPILSGAAIQIPTVGGGDTSAFKNVLTAAVAQQQQQLQQQQQQDLITALALSLPQQQQQQLLMNLLGLFFPRPNWTFRR